MTPDPAPTDPDERLLHALFPADLAAPPAATALLRRRRLWRRTRAAAAVALIAAAAVVLLRPAPPVASGVELITPAFTLRDPEEVPLPTARWTLFPPEPAAVADFSRLTPTAVPAHL